MPPKHDASRANCPHTAGTGPCDCPGPGVATAPSIEDFWKFLQDRIGQLFELHWRERTEFGDLLHKWVGISVKKTQRNVWVRFFHEHSTTSNEFFVGKTVIYFKPIASIEESDAPPSAKRFFAEEDGSEQKPRNKGRRAEIESDVTTMLDAMDNKQDGMVWDNLAPGLKVPAHVDESFSIFYPHLWGAGDEEQWEKIYKEFRLKYAVAYRTQEKLNEHEFYVATFKQFTFYNFRTKIIEGGDRAAEMYEPSTKEHWKPIMVAAMYLFASLAIGATPPGRTDGMEKAMEAFEGGKMDFKKLWTRTPTDTFDEQGMANRLKKVEKDLSDQRASTQLSAQTRPQYIYVSPPTQGRGSYGRGAHTFRYRGRGGRGGRD